MSMSNPLSIAVDRKNSLVSWLVTHAYPIWATAGFDADSGFQEKLGPQGRAIPAPRRARVQPRQIYAFSAAAALGWTGPAQDLADRAMALYLARFRREDGLFRTLVAEDGTGLDDRADLYDQAFALFGLSCGGPARERMAITLRDRLCAECQHANGGFMELPRGTLPLQSNPNMHLLEASLAWQAAGTDSGWGAMADGIAELALSRFIDRRSGLLREFFDADWRPADGMPGRIVEPGHQFEWAWLLLRWGNSRNRPDAVTAALRLIDIAETHGVDPARGVAFNALLDDFSIQDHGARLWPQTERIKANALAAMVTGKDEYWAQAARAADGLALYLNTAVQGLWWDKLAPDGTFANEPAPASSFYHIVCAIAELDRLTKAALSGRDGADIA